MRDPFVVAVAVAYLVLGAAWGLLLPTFESVDEQNHYRYMVFLKDQGRLPRQLPLPPEVTGEGHQPPLYYALGALGLRLFSPSASFTEPPRAATVFNRQPVYFVHGPGEGLLRFDGQAWPPHLLRLLQLGLWLFPGVLLLAWMFEQLLPPTQARMVLALLTLNPGFVALAGALNNDHGAWVLGSAALACLLPALKGRPLEWRHWLGFGVAAGLAGLAKPTALGLALLVPVCCLLRPGEWRKPGPWLALGALGSLLLGWFWRNYSLYGDATAWNALVADCPQCVDPKPLLNWHWWWFWSRRTFETYWSVFGWMTWRASPAVTWGFFGLVAAAVTGLFGGRPDTPDLAPAGRAMAWTALAGVGVVVLRHDMWLDPPAGRYFYVALVPIGLLLGSGLSAWRWPPWSPWLLSLLLLALNLWLLFGRLIPGYYP